MPRLSTPRIFPTARVIFLPGMNAPGGTKTPFIPARALGAPHTTCTGSPSPVSTRHTRSRSALGCGSAEMTRAIENGDSWLPRSATLSTSRPTMVSLSTIAASGAPVSRCSLSQASVNFIAATHDRRLREWTVPCRKACANSVSPAQAAGEGGKLERAKTIVGEPANVRFKERPQIRNAVFEHGNTIDAESPGEPLIFVGVEPAIAQYIGMHHSAAENLHPILAFAEADLPLLALALNVHFKRRLGEWKE